MGSLELQQCDRFVSIPDAVHRGKGCIGAWNATPGRGRYEVDDETFDGRHFGCAVLLTLSSSENRGLVAGFLALWGEQVWVRSEIGEGYE